MQKEIKDMTLQEVKEVITDTLVHNGFIFRGYSDEHIMHYGKDANHEADIIVADEGCFIEVRINYGIVNSFTGALSMLTDTVLFRIPQKDEYDMYDELGNPDEILVRALGYFYKKMKYLELMEDGYKLCIAEEPETQLFITTDVPF